MRTFLCLSAVHIFLYFCPWSRKIRGLDPKKCSKSRIFYVEAPAKGFVRFWRFDGRRKTAFSGEIGRIFAVARLVYAPTRFLDACNRRGISYERAELAYCQGVSKVCPRCVQDAIQSSKQRDCDPFGVIYSEHKALIYSEL